MDKLVNPSNSTLRRTGPAMNENKGYSILSRRSVVQKVNIERLETIHLYWGFEMVECVEECLVFSPIILVAPEFDDFFEC